MPRRRRHNRSICIEPGCPEFATYRGRCAAHNAAHQRKPTGTGERGSTYTGRKVRERVLYKARDAAGVPRCFYCDFRPATISDHYIPLALGGADSEGNQVAACRPCNSTKSDQMPGDFLASSWLARRCADVATGRDAA